MKKDDYVKIVGADGNYRYGFIEETRDRGLILNISLFDEGESKVAYDAAHRALVGEGDIDYLLFLTDIDKQIVPLLADGRNTNEIAEAMSICPATVRAHLRELRMKLHLDDRAQLIAFSSPLATLIKKANGEKT